MYLNLYGNFSTSCTEARVWCWYSVGQCFPSLLGSFPNAPGISVSSRCSFGVERKSGVILLCFVSFHESLVTTLKRVCGLHVI